jgi:hypothetical protein
MSTNKQLKQSALQTENFHRKVLQPAKNVYLCSESLSTTRWSMQQDCHVSRNYVTMTSQMKFEEKDTDATSAFASDDVSK